MKVGLVLRMIIVLFFLGQYHTVAARPHISGVERLEDLQQQMGVKQVNVQAPVPQWWSEDYSLPHRRWPVHNKLDP